MKELINRLKEITNLSELENISAINTNALIYAIAKSERYELLNGANIRLNISDSVTLEKLIDFLLSTEDILYDMHTNGFAFSKDELDAMFTVVFQKYQYAYQFENFFKYFFSNKDELNDFIKEHEQFFENYISEEKYNVSNILKDCDSFVELILKGNHAELVGNLENYSISNLKLLVQFLKQNNKLPYYIGNSNRLAQHLFEVKSSLDLSEFSILIDLLKEKSEYSIKERDSEMTSFSILVNENIDYLIEFVSQTKSMPKCLAESTTFRDECIKRNRIDLAVKCILSPDIMHNEALINAYCNELNIEPKDFYERSKWLLEYHEKNNNVFNTFLATSLKTNIFNLNKEHFERFINDVKVQVSVAKLNDKELIVLSRILNTYSYKEYDIAPMIVNVINNISNYQELVNTLDIENISEQDLRKLVSILQLPNNQYQISDINSLQDYDALKKHYFINNNSNELIANKDNLLKVLFNIDLEEAKYINYKYCYDTDNNSMLENLRNSELPQQTYDYLALINKIVECASKDELSALYNSLNNNIYNLEIPFESYLRAQYTKLYSQSLYRIDERNQIYGPKDSILNEINYNGKNIQVCIPRANFNFFVHCVGFCSIASNITDTNYRNDWLDRPQLQDHFVACSYINEKRIFSIIGRQGSIILGFDTLESGSILGMGNTDIDSIGRCAKDYDGSRELQEGNGSRARYFVPSEILKTTNNGYNEIVVERRNTDQSRSEEFKRMPDYIIMMAESMEQDNFNYLETLYQNQLSFISDEDKKVIQHIGNSKKLEGFLGKYKDLISQSAEAKGIPLNNLTNMYVDLIMKAKYYEDCLKASSEFGIPLVVVDKTYYFNKLLTESVAYDEETKGSISEFYSQANEYDKKKMFNMVAGGKDITQIMKPKESNKISISL